MMDALTARYDVDAFVVHGVMVGREQVVLFPQLRRAMLDSINAVDLHVRAVASLPPWYGVRCLKAPFGLRWLEVVPCRVADRVQIVEMDPAAAGRRGHQATASGAGEEDG